jgi:acyl-CoA reductase-like NAD-dependent aldehyde dehydrogenase
MSENPENTVKPFWIAGKPATGERQMQVHDPHGAVVGAVSVPTDSQVQAAIAAAANATVAAAKTSAHQRAAALEHIALCLLARRDEVARLISAENGKPIKWAQVEVSRSASVFRLAAEEARRWNGDMQRLDTETGNEGRLALVRRIPKGPVLAIAPFNFPLNLVAHKVAPALAVGAPVIVKPAPATPMSALLLGELLAETDLPRGMWSVLPIPNERMPDVVADPRLPVVSFTGSTTVGNAIRDAVPAKDVILELGGNAAAVVLGDYAANEELDLAAQRIALFANYQAGQSCISVQRVIVERSLADELTARIVAAVEGLVCGSSADPATEVGPLVDEAAAQRVEQWIDEAVNAGAKLLTGGDRERAFVSPAVLVDVPADQKLWADEVFGPVLAITAVDGVDEAIAAVNASRFGLQAGVFTKDVGVAFRMFAELEVGGVVIGDVPSFRADQMPYGGVKDSGQGREGVRSAMTDFTYERVMVLSGIQM